MSKETYKYTKDHEWLSAPVDGVCKVGISDHAQEEMGDIVHIELPEPPVSLDKGEAAATIESVKAASDVYAPVSGELVKINEDLEDNFQLINESPYGEGWLFELKLENTSDLDELMSFDEYQEFLES